MNYLIFNIFSFHQELKSSDSLITQHQLIISAIVPYECSSYFPLPKELRNPAKELINVQNKDNDCFTWCLFRYLKPVNKIQ